MIWRARDTRLGRYVAIKTLPASKTQRTDLRQRFVEEARLTAQLQHPGIPPVHELRFLPEGRPFLVVKLVRGQTLQQLLQSRTSLEDRRPFFLRVLEQVCHTVGYAHSHRVIHRDLKPSNIMVGSHGEVQVMDWGSAKLLDARPAPAFIPTPSDLTLTAIPEADSESLTQAGAVLGTPAYMSPEQAAGQVHLVDTRSDVFGLDAILCQILTGHPPYCGTNVQEIRHKVMCCEIEDAFTRLANCSVEQDLLSRCRWCLAFRPDDRPNDTNMVAEELAGIRQRAEERARRAELQRSQAPRFDWPNPNVGGSCYGPCLRRSSACCWQPLSWFPGRCHRLRKRNASPGKTKPRRVSPNSRPSKICNGLWQNKQRRRLSGPTKNGLTMPRARPGIER